MATAAAMMAGSLPDSVCAIVAAYFPDADSNARLQAVLPQVARVVVIDNTPRDSAAPSLAERHSDLQFIRCGITVDTLEGEFDLILMMIDAIEHIVSEEKLDFAMDNVQRCLADNGRFMVVPVATRGRRSLFYVKFWTVEDIKRRLSACLFGEPKPFRDDGLLMARKPPGQLLNAG
jgi:hypothetical protein